MAVKPTEPLPSDETVAATAGVFMQDADAFAACERKLADADLGRYFSVLFLPPRQRAALAALYAFWEEVREIRDECTDADVARVKLAWWHEELHETLAERPRHPVTVALLPAIRERRLPGPAFFEIVEALARPIVQAEFASYQELVDYARHSRGAVEDLAARVVTGAPVPNAIGALGARLEIVQLLASAGADARRGRCYLPQEDCMRFGATIADLSAATPAARALIGFEIERVEREVRENLGDAAERPSALAIAARLALVQLRKIRTHPEDALRRGVRIAPLHQLWIAWRTARRGRG